MKQLLKTANQTTELLGFSDYLAKTVLCNRPGGFIWLSTIQPFLGIFFVCASNSTKNGVKSHF